MATRNILEAPRRALAAVLPLLTSRMPWARFSSRHARNNTSTARFRGRFRLALEPLEQRQLLAVDGFVAYNDHVSGPDTHANTTLWGDTGGGGGTSGLLRDIVTGESTGVTLTTRQVGVRFATSASQPALNTDAADIFAGFVDFSSGRPHSLEINGGDSYTHSFSGLDERNTYEFAGTAIRGNDAYTNRWTLVTLVGADAFTPAHSDGVGIVTDGLPPNQVAMWVGANHRAAQGFVAHWTDIEPGDDGRFDVVSQQYRGPTPGVGTGDSSSGSKGYALVGIRLVENDLRMNVLSVTPADGVVVLPAPQQATIEFNRPLVVASVDAGDLTIDGQPAEDVTLLDDHRLRFDLPAGLASGEHVLQIADGAVLGGDDLPVEAFSSTFIVPTTATVENLAPRNVGAFTAELAAEVLTTGGDDPQVYVYWGDNDGGTDEEQWDHEIFVGQSGEGELTAGVSGLNEQTQYYYRALTSNLAGDAWAPATDSFQTITLGLAAVENAAATQIDAFSAIVGGRVTDTGGDPPTITMFFGQSDGGTDIASWGASVVIGSRADDFSTRLGELSADTIYFFRALASNGKGEAWADSSLTFQTLEAPGLQISEFMASNDGSLRTRVRPAPGEPLGPELTPDWIEIFNPTDRQVSLDGFHLTDDEDEKTKWEFPAVATISAGGYLVIFASDENITDPALDERGVLHTNFNLDARGEYLALTTSAGEVLHEYAPEFPAQVVDVSYGISDEEPRYFAAETPGEANSSQFIDFVTDTKFSVDRGFFDESFAVEIVTETSDATIRYTLDGSRPSATRGTVYAGPISIARTTTLSAIAVRPGFRPTNVDTQTYIFVDDVVNQTFQSTINAGFPSSWNGTSPDYGLDSDVIGPNDRFGGIYAQTIRDDLTSIPTLSLVLPIGDMFGSGGIYSNPGDHNREVATSVELIYPDGSEGFQINAGLKIQGGAFRSFGLTRKKSFRLKFKDIYGAGKLDFPFFGDDAADEFDTITLRMNANDGWQWSGSTNRQYARDEWGRRTQLALGQPASHGNFMHLYINGVYWGLYNPVERPDHSFGATYAGGEKDDWDVRNHGGTVNGDSNAWNTMLSQARDVASKSGASQVAAWQRIQGNNPDGTNNPNFEDYLDVDNLIDYMIVNLYGGNSDWPHNNYYYGRQRGPDSTGFKFYMWDAEWSLNLQSNVSTNKTGVSAGVASPYAILKGVPEFRMRFADRLQQHFFNGGAMYVDPNNPAWDPTHPERNVPAARYAEIADEIASPLVAESARWGDQHQSTPHTVEGSWRPQLEALLRVGDSSSYFARRSAIVLSQFQSAQLFSSIAAPTFSQRGGTISIGFPLTLGSPGGAGTIYYTTDGSDPRLIGGGVNNASARAYDGSPIELDGNVLIRARALSNGQWSAIDGATFLLDAPPPLRITEIMYNPADPTPEEIDAGFVDNDQFEFIELMNTGDRPLELFGTRFSDGIEFDFNTSVIESLSPGERLVVVRNSAAFAMRYENVENVAGSFADDSRLVNGGERIRLEASLGQIIHEFSYDNAWYPATEGDGFSLVIVDETAELEQWDRAEGWRPGGVFGGSPGTDDQGLLPGVVVINEVLAHSDAAPGDWIELYNTTSEEIDLGGWFLSDDNVDLTKFQIPPNTILPGGGHLVFNQRDHFGNLNNPRARIPFGLSELGDEVILASLDPTTGGPGSYREKVEFAATENGGTLGRYVNSAGFVDFVATVRPTRGEENTPPAIPDVLINEIMYHPIPDGVEYIELTNRSLAEVPLFDPLRPQNTWSFTDGVLFDFPQGVSLSAGGFLLVVQSDPNEFRSLHGLPQSMQIFGPYTNRLDDAGEKLELSRPGKPELDGTVPLIVNERVRFNDRAPWPLTPDGNGPSLARSDLAGWGNDPQSWGAGTSGGTPGRLNRFTDSTPPSAPANLSAGLSRGGQLEVSWTPAIDLDSGVVRYLVFRDGGQIGTSTTTSFVDGGAAFDSDHTYTVSAVNVDSAVGEPSVPLEISVTGFQQGALPSASYGGQTDAELNQENTNTNFAGDLTLRADGDVGGDGFEEWTLMRWDLSSVTRHTEVLGASLTLNVTNSSPEPYFLYEVLRPWVEDQVTWNQAADNQLWQAGGAKGAADRGAQIMGTVSFGSEGRRTAKLNADGVALLQSWIDGEKPNHGFLLFSPTNDDSLQFDSSEAADIAARPKLSLSVVTSDNQSPQVIEAIVNAAPALREIVVQFTENVQVEVESLVLYNDVSGKAISPDDMALAYNVDARMAVWTFPSLPGGQLPRGDYTATLTSADVTDVFGNPLDGNRDGAGGDNFVIQLTSGGDLLADLTGDNFVDFDDLTLLLAHWNQMVSAGQGNLVDPLTTPVNFQDLTLLLAAWTGPGPVGAPQAAATETTVQRDTAIAESRIATNAHFDRLGHRRLGHRNLVTRRRGHVGFAPTNDSPLRRLQAAAVDRAMGDNAADKVHRRDMLFSRRDRRSERRGK